VRSIRVRVAASVAVACAIAMLAVQSTQAQNFQTLYSFTGEANGEFPYAQVTRDAEGNIYGTTAGGGLPSANCPFECGTVFRVNESGDQSVIYRFCAQPGCTEVRSPAQLWFGTARAISTGLPS